MPLTVAPFGPAVPLYCLSTFETSEIDSVNTGNGVIIAFEDPSRSSMQSGGISFYCGVSAYRYIFVPFSFSHHLQRYVVEGDTVKLSIYAKSKWYTKCEVNKNYGIGSGDYIAFEFKGGYILCAMTHNNYFLKAYECISSPCLNGGTCTNTIANNMADYTCTCPTGTLVTNNHNWLISK
jgi:hypothetical protein